MVQQYRDIGFRTRQNSSHPRLLFVGWPAPPTHPRAVRFLTLCSTQYTAQTEQLSTPHQRKTLASKFLMLGKDKARRPPSDFALPPLPPGSALKFGKDAPMVDQRFPSLLSNLEGEMSRLLEWASKGDAQSSQGQRLRTFPAVPQGQTHTANIRHEEVRDFLKERADVHQRRAKRREIADSTAVRLPRETEAQKLKRRGKDREISYLSDGGSVGASAVPASVIPDAFKIVMESPFPTREPGFYSVFGDADEDNWAYNAATRHFEAVLFPSKVPAGRRDVLLLHAWVNDMISRLKRTSSALREEEMLKDAQLLFSVAFHEIIRQVSVHCLERGYLMGKIWWSEMELFQRMLSLHRRADQALQQERKERLDERQQMQHRIDELERQMAEMKLAHAAEMREMAGARAGQADGRGLLA